MIIRKETQSDFEEISNITKLAFENHPYSRNTEHFIIRALRAADALTVSLVAENDGRMVGHIAFSPVSFSDGSENWYGVGPISVVPDCQRQGIGKQLINEGINLLKGRGAKGCILVGDPNYYQRLGFKNPGRLSHEGVPPENLLVFPFSDSTPAGIVEFHKAFWATE